MHGDHLGSTSLTTDQSGAVVAESRYLPYGQERWSSGALPTDFGFTGQSNERGFGLMDYQARYYSPVLGRFVSPDSIVPNFTNPQALNRYSYVLNRPLQGGDPTGHDGPVDFVLGAAAQIVDNAAAFLPPDNLIRKPNYDMIVDYQNNMAFQGGRVVGSVVSMVLGAAEVTQGAAGTLGGGAACASTPADGVGVLGCGVAPVEAAIAAHGIVNGLAGAASFGDSMGNLINAMSGRGGGGRSRTPFDDVFEDPSKAPGKDWEWRGKGSPGSSKGSWYNPKTEESIHLDLSHPDPIGPHLDYTAPDGTVWRVFADGTRKPK